MNVFVDIEFSREKNEITSIGAIYDKNTFTQKLDKLNKNPRELLVKFYNSLPSESVNFMFFGKEDMRMLEKCLKKLDLPENIENMVKHMTAGIDITEYLKPLRFSLEDFVNNLGGNLSYPLHDPLNDAINLQTLFTVLHGKKAISKLLKLYKSTGSKLGNLDKELNEKLKTLDIRCSTPGYKKGFMTPVLYKIVLINKENGEQFVLNNITPEELTQNDIYSIKAPKIFDKYKGKKQECVIWLLENVDGETLTIENFTEKMAEETGNSLEFCEKLVEEMAEKCDLLRLSSSVYQINEDIKLLDKGQNRRFLFGKNRIKVIC